MLKKIVCEAFGTFRLVFVGTGAIVINEITSGTISHVGVSLTFGLIVLVMILAIGEISGAHINPAVTFAFVIRENFRSVSFFLTCLLSLLELLLLAFRFIFCFP